MLPSILFRMSHTHFPDLPQSCVWSTEDQAPFTVDPLERILFGNCYHFPTVGPKKFQNRFRALEFLPESRENVRFQGWLAALGDLQAQGCKVSHPRAVPQLQPVRTPAQDQQLLEKRGSSRQKDVFFHFGFIGKL